MGDKPLIVQQVDAFCKVLAIIDGQGKIDKKMLNTCEDDIEKAVLDNDIDGFQRKYTNVYGKDIIDKANAIQAVFMELMKNVTDSAHKTE